MPKAVIKKESGELVAADTDGGELTDLDRTDCEQRLKDHIGHARFDGHKLIGLKFSDLGVGRKLCVLMGTRGKSGPYELAQTRRQESTSWAELEKDVKGLLQIG